MRTKLFKPKTKLVTVEVGHYVRDVILNGRKAKSKEVNLAYSLGWLLYKFEYKHGRECRPVEISALEWRKDWGQTEEMRVLWDNVVRVRHKGFALVNADGNRSTRTKDNVPNEYELIVDDVLKVVRILAVSADELVKSWILREIERTITGEHAEELVSGEFLYSVNRNELSSRRYHPLTNKPKVIRNHVFAGAGYVHEYDVQACFPTLLVQLADHLAQEARGGGSTALGASIYTVPAMAECARDVQGFRRRVAVECRLMTADGAPDVGKVKLILSALLFGARLSPLTDAMRVKFSLGRWSEIPAILAAVDGDYRAYQRVIDSKLVKAYRADIVRLTRLARGAISDLLRRNGQTPDKLFRSKKYLYWYCEMMEAVVRDAMCEFVRDYGGRVFELHDCVFTSRELEIADLEERIYERTGYSVRLTHKQVSQI